MEGDMDEADQDIGGQDGTALGRDYVAGMLANMDLGSPSSPSSPIGSSGAFGAGGTGGYGAQGMGRQPSMAGSTQFNGSNPDLLGISSRNSSTDSMSQQPGGAAASGMHPAYAGLDSLAGAGSAPAPPPAARPPPAAAPSSYPNAMSPPTQSAAFGAAGMAASGAAAAAGGGRATGGFVPPKVLLLNPQNARGLEITGTVGVSWYSYWLRGILTAFLSL